MTYFKARDNYEKQENSEAGYRSVNILSTEHSADHHTARFSCHVVRELPGMNSSKCETFPEAPPPSLFRAHLKLRASNYCLIHWFQLHTSHFVC
jgi:hypothetical protein